MAFWTRSAGTATLALAATLVAHAGAFAQDGKELGAFFTAELTTVWVAGNSQSASLGFAGTAGYVWPRSTVKLEGGGVQTESSITTRTAIGSSPDAYVLEEETVKRTTAEAYYARGRYDYAVSKAFFFFGGGDWLRNTFAGIDSRFLVAAGAGNAWAEKERLHFKTDYGITYTFQEDVVENPFTKTNFPGARLSYDLWWKVTGSADFTSVLISDFNLDNTDDVRLDFTNALPIAISSKLALKPSLRLLWRNDPALAAVPLVESDGTPTGLSVLVPYDKLDSFFTIALVLKI